MNEEPTKDLSNGASFEERVFARFDSVDARLEKLESRAYDTKPIWERALKEIMELRGENAATKKDVSDLKYDVSGLKTDVSGLKSDVAGIKIDIGETKRELKEFKRDATKRLIRILSIQLENRADLSEAEERIDALETKLA